MISQPVTRLVRFVVFDHLLRDDVTKVVEKCRQSATFKFGFFNVGDCSVVCVSALPDDPGLRELAKEQSAGRPCGVIMRTENRQKWNELSESHKERPLAFIIASGGPKEKFKTMFPSLTVQTVMDFEPPFDKEVANYIVKRFEQRFEFAR